MLRLVIGRCCPVSLRRFMIKWRVFNPEHVALASTVIRRNMAIVRMMVGTGDKDDGGDIHVTAGETTSSKQTGGAIRMIAGTGSSPHFADGGDGGHFQIHGGAANGGKTSNDGGNHLYHSNCSN